MTTTRDGPVNVPYVRMWPANRSESGWIRCGNVEILIARPAESHRMHVWQFFPQRQQIGDEVSHRMATLCQ